MTPGTAPGAGSLPSPNWPPAGVTALAIDLPGHGDDPGPMGDLHGDAAHVSSVLDSLDGPVVLAGHAYGGAVITEAAATRPSPTWSI